MVTIALQQPASGAHVLEAQATRRNGGRVGIRRDHLVRDGAADAKRNHIKPWNKNKKEWFIPHLGDKFVERMEDVLDLY